MRTQQVIWSMWLCWLQVYGLGWIRRVVDPGPVRVRSVSGLFGWQCGDSRRSTSSSAWPRTARRDFDGINRARYVHAQDRRAAGSSVTAAGNPTLIAHLVYIYHYPPFYNYD